MSEPGGTIPPSSALDRLLTSTERAAERAEDRAERQHAERMTQATAFAAANIGAIQALTASLDTRLGRAEGQIAAVQADTTEIKARLPGPKMQAVGLAFAGMVLVLLILLVATAHGVDVSPAVQGVQTLGLTPPASTVPASTVPASSPSTLDPAPLP